MDTTRKLPHPVFLPCNGIRYTMALIVSLSQNVNSYQRETSATLSKARTFLKCEFKSNNFPNNLQLWVGN